MSGAFCPRAWVPGTDDDIQEFLLPWDCTDVVFLRRRLVILHRNGFFPVDIPLPAERNAEHKTLIKKCASGQPLGMFRLPGEAFLLCYDSEYPTDRLRSSRVTRLSTRIWGLY